MPRGCLGKTAHYALQKSMKGSQYSLRMVFLTLPTPSLSHGLLRTGTQCFGLSADRHVPMEAALLLSWAARNLSQKGYK